MHQSLFEKSQWLGLEVCKSKVIPLHGGAWGERMYSSCSFLTLALDGSEWSAGRALPPGKGTPVPIGSEDGWAPEPVWTKRLEEKSSAPIGDQTPIVQPVVRHYTAWATAAPLKFVEKIIHKHVYKYIATTNNVDKIQYILSRTWNVKNNCQNIAAYGQ
jgi:hypothetical protein